MILQISAATNDSVYDVHDGKSDVAQIETEQTVSCSLMLGKVTIRSSFESGENRKVRRMQEKFSRVPMP